MRRAAVSLVMAGVFCLLLSPAHAQDEPAKKYASHPPMRALPTPSDRPLADGPTYFVDAANGDDTGNGSRERPYRTIAKALEKLRPGDTLCLRGGVFYQPTSIALAGTAEQPITIRGFPGELAIIDAGIPEFFDTPADAWRPAKDGLPDEYVSTATYRGLEKVFGNFGDSMVPLHGYKNLIDLRSDNEFWNGGGKLDTDWSIYCGPGVWYDQTSGRIHCRLAHTRMKVLGPDNYRGETDPRKLPLVVTAAPNALHVRLAQHVHIQDLVLRGARKCALNIEHSVGIKVENVVGYGSDPVVNLRGNHEVLLSHCQFRGIAAPWSFRSSHKYRGTPAYLLVAQGDDATNQQIEIADCELTDSHDGPFVGTIRGLKFHHNLVDNFNDDGVYLTAMSLGGDVHIYQNRISRCLTSFSFFGEYPVGKGVWIYRNVVDLRTPVHYFQTSGEDDERFVAGEAGERYRFPSAGRLCGDHGGPTWEPIHFYHNTVIARDAAFRNYYGQGWGGHLRSTERWVMNNVFVQTEGWPGLVVLKDETENLHADGNMHFGQGERPQPDSRYPPPEGDLFVDPHFLDDLVEARKPANVALGKDSPAIDAGVAISKDWPDTLADEDSGKPDVGALPRGVDASVIGPAVD